MKEVHHCVSKVRHDLSTIEPDAHRSCQWHRLVVICLLAASFNLQVLANPPATRPSPQDMATPRGALIAYDHWCVDLKDFDDAAAFYSATTDQERAVVQECLKFDQLSAAMERLSRAAFGPDSCTAILHEYGEADISDLRSANIETKGDIATVRMPAIQLELQMVKVGDAWLVDSAALIQSFGGFNNAIQAMTSQMTKLQPIVDGLQSSKFKTAKEVIQSINQAMGAQK
jgi:hypothetical protein